MSLPRLLDLFCCQGGAGMGYHIAGFDVVGVDIDPQPRYPFEFHQGDALTFPLDGFDVVHASPPCEDHSAAMQFGNIEHHGTGHLLSDTIDRLTAWGGPWIVENVEGADMPGALTLCGTEFGLGANDHTGQWRHLRRHRRFLSNLPLMGAGRCFCRGQRVGGVYGHGPQGHNGGRGYGFAADAAREAMQMPWASRGRRHRGDPARVHPVPGRAGSRLHGSCRMTDAAPRCPACGYPLEPLPGGKGSCVHGALCTHYCRGCMDHYEEVAL